MQLARDALSYTPYQNRRAPGDSGRSRDLELQTPAAAYDASTSRRTAAAGGGMPRGQLAHAQASSRQAAQPTLAVPLSANDRSALRHRHKVQQGPRSQAVYAAAAQEAYRVQSSGVEAQPPKGSRPSRSFSSYVEERQQLQQRMRQQAIDAPAGARALPGLSGHAESVRKMTDELQHRWHAHLASSQPTTRSGHAPPNSDGTTRHEVSRMSLR